MSLRMMIFCGILLPTLCQAQSSLEIETTPLQTHLWNMSQMKDWSPMWPIVWFCPLV